MLDVQADKLRLRVKTILQFATTDADKLRAIYRYVAAIPFDVPALGSPKSSRRTIATREAVGWYSKAALFQSMLRIAGFPARIRMIRVGPEMYRGLADTTQVFVLPTVEVWTGGRWIITDNYVYDPWYLAAAREALNKRGWRSGFGIHLDGRFYWNGKVDSLCMIVPHPGEDGVPVEYLGVFPDPMAFSRRLKRASWWNWAWLVARNRVMSIRMSRNVRRLRDGGFG